ncbi:MAG: NnrU family protein [Vitreimonas sp.]
MNGFAWALALFVLIHVGVSATGLRATLLARIGEGPYRAVFALVSLGLLVWLIQGFGAMRADPFDPLNEALWAPPAWLRGPAMGLAALGVIFVVAGLFAPGPTLAGYEKRGLERAEPAYGMLRITRHPFLWGVALWAAGHLLANGERFALMLFGALGLMVLFGARSIDRKGRARDAEGYARFEAVSSNIPFAAIVQGRNRLALGEIAIPVLVGLAVALLAAWGHANISGGTALF